MYQREYKGSAENIADNRLIDKKIKKGNPIGQRSGADCFVEKKKKKRKRIKNVRVKRSANKSIRVSSNPFK